MGVCSLSGSAGTLYFRTDPNSVTWEYTLNTKVEQTYGGRVVQILSANIHNLQVKADCGNGGWPYLQKVATFFRDSLIEQMNTQEPLTFSYPTRNWRMKVYLVSFPLKDSNTEVLREFTLNLEVQEDLTGYATTEFEKASIAGSLLEGIGYEKNEYNDPDFAAEGAPGDTERGRAHDGPFQTRPE